MDRGAPPTRGTTGDRPADSRDQGAGLGTGALALATIALEIVTLSAAKSRAWRYEKVEAADELRATWFLLRR